MLSRREALALPATCCLCGVPFFRSARAADGDDPTKVFAGDKKPTDYRLGAPKTLNSDFPFVVPKTKEAWEKRKKELREQLLVANGLWPLPEKTPLAPVVHGKIERDGYTIEKVYFASMPGHYVSGNLYRPKDEQDGKPRKHPAVLNPHGHWANGRFLVQTDATQTADKKRGAETTDDAAKSPLQAKCANLAMQGFVVFHYDMVGYADSTAIGHRAGFTDAAAELRLQNFMGLQTWNTIRAYDFLEALPDVDPKRIGVTGASGGGTQTFIFCALDDRPAASFPAVMVGTVMQGGCICENCSHLRVGTGNVEFAAMFAPRPQALSCADDWTKDFPTKGFPELQALYELYGAKDKVAQKAWLTFPHNYSQPSREFMYTWFAKHLMGKDGEVKEKPFKFVPVKELSVFDAEHPRPKDELNAAKLREQMTKASDVQIAKLTPKDAKSLAEYKRVIGAALRAMVNSELPKEIAVRVEPVKGTIDGLTVHRAAIGRTDEKDALPGCGVTGEKYNGEKAVIWLHPQGKSGLFPNGKALPAVKAFTDAGFGVLAPDLLGTGELSFAKGWPVDKGFAGYTYGYNRTLLANRVHDALTLIAFAKSFLKNKTIHLVGWDEFGTIAILAKALAGDAVAKTAADLNEFTFEKIEKTDDPMMLPGAVKYGGLGAFLALCAPGEVLVHNHKGTDTGKVSRAAYEAAGAANKLTRSAEKLDAAKVVEWLVK